MNVLYIFFAAYFLFQNKKNEKMRNVHLLVMTFISLISFSYAIPTRQIVGPIYANTARTTLNVFLKTDSETKDATKHPLSTPEIDLILSRLQIESTKFETLDSHQKKRPSIITRTHLLSDAIEFWNNRKIESEELDVAFEISVHKEYRWLKSIKDRLLTIDINTMSKESLDSLINEFKIILKTITGKIKTKNESEDLKEDLRKLRRTLIEKLDVWTTKLNSFPSDFELIYKELEVIGRSCYSQDSKESDDDESKDIRKENDNDSENESVVLKNLGGLIRRKSYYERMVDFLSE